MVKIRRLNRIKQRKITSAGSHIPEYYADCEKVAAMDC